MATGIRVDRHFLIEGKPVSAKGVRNTLKPIVPRWFYSCLDPQGDRIVVRDAKFLPGEEDDPSYENWKQVYQSIRDASSSGDWRLMSAATVDKPGEGGEATSVLRIDYQAGARPLTHGGREFIPHLSEGKILGWTNASEALANQIHKLHKGTEVRDEHSPPVDGNEGVAVISTRVFDESGKKTNLSKEEIAITILHELAAHAGIATGAAQSSEAHSDWRHHKTEDLDDVADLGERPTAVIARFLKKQALLKIPALDSPAADAPPEPRSGFLERLRRFFLRPPSIDGVGAPPSSPAPNQFQQNLRLQQERQLQLQRNMQRQGALQRDQLQQQLQRAAQQRMMAEQQRLRDQQLRQSQDQRARDQLRLQDMLRRQADLQRQAQQQAAQRRAAEDQQRRAREQAERTRQQQQRTARAISMPSRPSPVYGGPIKTFVSPKLWERPKVSTTMTLPIQTHKPPPMPPRPRPPSPPPFSRPLNRFVIPPRE